MASALALQAQSGNRRVLSVFSLVMMSVTAVDSLRSLPITAQYGFSLIFYYLLAAVVFFLPSALASAELATGWPANGGIYVWVKEAFGTRAGMMTIWFQWIYNVFWYPTVLSLMAATIAYLFKPDLANSSEFMLAAVLIIFWGATLLSCFGMQVSSRLINIATVLGTLVPILLISLLGVIWFSSGKPVQFKMTWAYFLPDLSHWHNLVLLTALLYGLIGMELPAMHAQEAKDPKRDYPKVMLIAGTVILATLILGSLAVAAVVPPDSLRMIDGLLKAFQLFFQAFHMGFLMPVVALMIFLGALGGITVWIIGPTKGLMISARDGALPPIFAKVNQWGAPVPMLIAQGLIFTALSTIFILVPNADNAFWILTDISAQLALFVYVAMFSALIKLHYSRPEVERSFKIPGGTLGIWTVGSLGIASSVLTIGIGLLPSESMSFHSPMTYVSFLIFGLLLAWLLPLMLYNKTQKAQ